jgi:DnaJ domain
VPFFIGGIILLLLLLAAARAFVNTDPMRLGRFIRWFLLSLGAFGACAIVVLLISSERLGSALALMGVLAPVILRGRTMWRRWQNVAGPRRGHVSEAATEYLRMRLDHDSGGMSGTVLKGRFAGRRLDELVQSDLVALWRECRLADEASARLMESYLDRLGIDWRGAPGDDARASTAPADAMTREEALAILGLAPGATAAQIKEAHRSLMMKLHPDHGGSTYLAAKINRAKEMLLGA